MVQHSALGRRVTLREASRWGPETNKAGVDSEGYAAEGSTAMKALVSADDQGGVLSVWREALGIVRRYPLASFFPAAVLGTLGAALPPQQGQPLVLGGGSRAASSRARR